VASHAPFAFGCLQAHRRFAHGGQHGGVQPLVELFDMLTQLVCLLLRRRRRRRHGLPQRQEVMVCSADDLASQEMRQPVAEAATGRSKPRARRRFSGRPRWPPRQSRSVLRQPAGHGHANRRTDGPVCLHTAEPSRPTHPSAVRSEVPAFSCSGDAEVEAECARHCPRFRLSMLEACVGRALRRPCLLHPQCTWNSRGWQGRLRWPPHTRATCGVSSCAAAALIALGMHGASVGMPTPQQTPKLQVKKAARAARRPHWIPTPVVYHAPGVTELWPSQAARETPGHQLN